MNEAYNWSEEQWNERLPLFYAAIENYVSAGISMLIPYKEHLRIFAGKKYATNPYYFAFADIIAQLRQYQHLMNITEPVDFIFDRGNSEEIQRASEPFFSTVPKEAKLLLGKTPKFEDDEEVLPLQAADLLAWWRRRNFEMRQDATLTTRAAPWIKKRELLYLEMEWSPERIQQAYDRLYNKQPDAA
jgi:hypothetical protein